MASYDDIINGSFKAVGAPPSYLSPAYNPADYASIYASPQPTYQSGMTGRGQPSSAGSPYLTTAEKAKLAQQTAASQNLQLPWQSTPSVASMYAGIYPETPASPTNPATWGAFEQANSDAANKPGTWMAQSRMQAQALMRQMALRNAGNPSGIPQPGGVPVAAARPQGLFDLLFGGGGGAQTSAGGGLAALLNQKSPQPYGGRYTPQELAARTAKGIAIGDANRASPTPTHDVAGNNNAFMSTSHQNSERWQTGY